jgi:TetR/AcrR family transcriptional repressor of nem operon
VAGSGVATLMADAGLTNGAFYGHFSSKDDLVAGVIADQLGAQRDRIADAGTDLEQLVRAYLSAEHRDNPAEGCPSAALLGEIAHSADAVRQAYTEGLLGVVDAVAARLDPGDPARVRVAVLAVLTGMFGTLQAARAVTDRRLSDELLEHGVQVALAQLGLDPVAAPSTEAGTT